MQDYRNLRVWQKAHNLALATYAISANLQKPDAWPLGDQIFRAAISCGTPWDPATNLSMICFLPETSDSCPWKPTGDSPGNSRRSGACSPASCSG